MAINPLNLRVQDTPGSEGFGRQRHLQVGDSPNGKTFADMVSNAIDDVDMAAKDADRKVQDVVTGKSENVHDAMIAMNKAQLSFQLMLEIRNKALDTYLELSRMSL